MNYDLKKVGNKSFLHIELPKVALKNSIFVLMVKDITGKLVMMLQDVKLPNEIRLVDLTPGKYILTLVTGKEFFSELIVA